MKKERDARQGEMSRKTKRTQQKPLEREEMVTMIDFRQLNFTQKWRQDQLHIATFDSK